MLTAQQNINAHKLSKYQPYRTRTSEDVTMTQDLVECSKGSHIPLTPISFLERAATVYGDKVSIIYNDHVRFSWRETYERCLKLASALVNLGISNGDIVSSFISQSPYGYIILSKLTIVCVLSS